MVLIIYLGGSSRKVMKKYEKPKLELIEVDDKDIILMSLLDGGVGGEPDEDENGEHFGG